MNLLFLSRGSNKMVNRVLLDYLHCIENGIEYNGERSYKNWNDDKLLLPLKSSECQIIADVMEDGHGLRAAYQFVNEYR